MRVGLKSFPLSSSLFRSSAGVEPAGEKEVPMNHSRNLTAPVRGNSGNQARPRSPLFPLALLLAFAFSPGARAETPEPSKVDKATRARVNESYGKLPLSFEANQGQQDQPVKFLSRGSGYNLFLTNREAVLVLTKSEKPARRRRRRPTRLLRRRSRSGNRPFCARSLWRPIPQPK